MAASCLNDNSLKLCLSPPSTQNTHTHTAENHGVPLSHIPPLAHAVPAAPPPAYLCSSIYYEMQQLLTRGYRLRLLGSKPRPSSSFRCSEFGSQSSRNTDFHRPCRGSSSRRDQGSGAVVVPLSSSPGVGSMIRCVSDSTCNGAPETQTDPPPPPRDARRPRMLISLLVSAL